MEKRVKAYSYLCYLVGLVALINAVAYWIEIDKGETGSFNHYLVILIYAIPALFCFIMGYGIGALRRWGKIGGIILGILMLPTFPLFTSNVLYGLLFMIVGVYGLWSLLSEKGAVFIRTEESPETGREWFRKDDSKIYKCGRCGHVMLEFHGTCPNCKAYLYVKQKK